MNAFALRALSGLTLAGLLAVSACTAEVQQVSAPDSAAAGTVTTTPSPSSTPPDPAEHAANELGDVPVLMYHRIVEQPQSVYDRTPADFEAELERLAREGYVPITTAQYVTGDIDIPAGAHPVVLTFDDGHVSQFSLTADGEPAPGTAVAILREVAARHPGFRPVASFYVNADPFGDPGGQRTIGWLVEHDMEVGNHTLTHANLRQSGPETVQQEIGRGDRAIRRAAPGFEPRTISLPFGLHPADAKLALAGTADGTDYRYRGALLVGANPAPSPYSADFDPLRVPRIRSQGASGREAEFGSATWLDKLAAPAAQRYTSDGVPDRISYPRDSGRTVATAYGDRAVAY